MSKQLLAWVALLAALAIALLCQALLATSSSGAIPGLDRGQGLLVPAAALLGVLIVLTLFARRPLGAGLEGTATSDASATTVSAHPRLALFVVSFVALFVEVLLIRYTSSQLRIFSFFKNVPLVAAYLGLGLGCWQSQGQPRHALRLLLWLLPLCVALSFGPQLLSDRLGVWAAVASSEHILGDVVAARPELVRVLTAQAALMVFCVVTLVSFALLFRLLGRLLGAAFEQLPRLQAYSINIAGSLAGIGVFLALSALQTAPWLWLLLGLAPLLWWLPAGRQRGLGAVLVLLTAASVAPSYGHTVWSRYQKLVGHTIPSGAGDDAAPAYLVEISDVFYQLAVDLRPAAVARRGFNPFPLYDVAMQALPPAARVLVVGAGTGNDVAAALRAGAAEVDAVDIDPAIVELGRRHHPEQPYSDPRVHVIVDDARAVFHTRPRGHYDGIVFGLLDSHSQLGISSVRLDNYVFTLQSLAEARDLLRPGGSLILTAATFRPWFRDRLSAMMSTACQGPVRLEASGVWSSFSCQVQPTVGLPVHDEQLVRTLPSDDWPFLYLPERTVPQAYLLVLCALAAASLVLLRRTGLRFGQVQAMHVHLFFLGAAFLLMEVSAINRLALLFGTTWLVSALTIAVVLGLILAANLCVAASRLAAPPLGYAGLMVSLVAGATIDSTAVLGAPLPFQLAYAILVLSPVFFAGMVFARSFSTVSLAGPALGANMFGAVLGGWIEYSVMVIGIRALALVALALYLASALALLRHRRSRA